MLEELLKWFNCNGVKYYKSKITEIEPMNNGLVATEEIQENEIIIEIPRDLLISSVELRLNQYNNYYKKYPHIFNSELNDQAEYNILVLFLQIFMLKPRIQEKLKQNSKYKPYIEYVKQPQNALSYQYDYIQSINDKNFQQVILKLQQLFEINYMRFQTFFKEQFSQDLDYSLFKWSYQFVMTRCFGGDEHLISSHLIPFADMLNHHDQSQTNHRFNGRKQDNKIIKVDKQESQGSQEQFVFYTLQKIKKGEQIYNFFGNLPNGFLLSQYGFCYQDNYMDKLYIELDDQNHLNSFSCYKINSSQTFSLRKYKLNEKLLKLISIEKYQALILEIHPNINITEIKESQRELLKLQLLLIEQQLGKYS